MANPIVAEVTRAGRVESIHRGSYVVCDADGTVVLSGGDIERAIFPRSAMKLIQALPLVESGAADAFAFDDRMLALACASHSSEPGHVETVTTMLARAGMGESDLACGPHWPLFRPEDIAKMASGGKRPGKVHNNCSGKHAGFLCACSHQGLTIPDYVSMEHPLQSEVRSALEQVTGTKIVADGFGTDGCSAPTYALPMQGLARGFARLATGTGLENVRAKAALRLMTACMAEPWHMAGTDRVCTDIMTEGAGRIFAKVGAEGVYAAALPEMGLGMALKSDDGNARAVEVLLGAIIARLFASDEELATKMAAFARRDIRTFAGENAGELRAVL